VDITDQPLAILGGPQAVPVDEPDLFHWPIVTDQDVHAVIEVLRAGSMSGLDVTRKFELEYAAFQQTDYALAFCNGTAALQAAMHACGVRRGHQIIAPSMTYWATALPAFSLGATVVFADIDPTSLCIDPSDIEHRITDQTKAIVPVHYCGHPADMDRIMAIARKHHLKVIEDVSHAHGGLYNGRLVGTFGHVAATSLMTGKSLAIGEGGILCTNDREILEAAIAFAHYQRHADQLTLSRFKAHAGLPLGGLKGRLNQTCSAMGRVQLQHYPLRMAHIQQAMNRFWDLLDGTPGLRPHRPNQPSGSTMGGWYNPLGHYLPEQLGGLDVATFVDAVKAEGARAGRSCNSPLHLHPLFNDADIYGDGRPTRIAFSQNDLRQPPGLLPVTEALLDRSYGVGWFKHDRPQSIARHAAAFRKVARQADQLLEYAKTTRRDQARAK